MRTIGPPPSHHRPTQQLRHLLSILHPPPPLSRCPVRVTVESSAAVPPSWRRCCLSFRRAAARAVASAAVSSSLSFVHCRRDRRHRRRWISAAAVQIPPLATAALQLGPAGAAPIGHNPLLFTAVRRPCCSELRITSVQPPLSPSQRCHLEPSLFDPPSTRRCTL